MQCSRDMKNNVSFPNVHFHTNPQIDWQILSKINVDVCNNFLSNSDGYNNNTFALEHPFTSFTCYLASLETTMFYFTLHHIFRYLE